MEKQLNTDGEKTLENDFKFDRVSKHKLPGSEKPMQ